MASAPRSGEYMDGQAWFTRKQTVLTIGVTNAGLEDIGEVESITLPEEGDDLTKSEVAVTIEGTSGTLELITPAAGLVHAANVRLAGSPETLSEDPLEEGWLVKIEIEDPTDLKEYADTSKGEDDSDDE
ncbi:MAG: glycine cleavage system protein H [Xanthomonadaceae bacterium]|nr:glycine cleavage system protein H [Xanthomonadaceae bacterium]